MEKDISLFFVNQRLLVHLSATFLANKNVIHHLVDQSAIFTHSLCSLCLCFHSLCCHSLHSFATYNPPPQILQQPLAPSFLILHILILKRNAKIKE